MKLSTFIKLVKKAYLVRYNGPITIKYVCYVVSDVRYGLATKHPKQEEQYNKLYSSVSAQIHKAIVQHVCVENYLHYKLNRKPTPEECHNFRLCMLSDMYEAADFEERCKEQ